MERPIESATFTERGSLTDRADDQSQTFPSKRPERWAIYDVI